MLGAFRQLQYMPVAKFNAPRIPVVFTPEPAQVTNHCTIGTAAGQRDRPAGVQNHPVPKSMDKTIFARKRTLFTRQNCHHCGLMVMLNYAPPMAIYSTVF
jgi:hypothetical protein